MGIDLCMHLARLNTVSSFLTGLCRLAFSLPVSHLRAGDQASMHYEYTSSSGGRKYRRTSLDNFPKMKCTYRVYKISKWEVVLGALDRLNTPCLMYDTLLCQIELAQNGIGINS